jgi:NAD(P)-dependent dehydrogenase (short-subunit alcohol dehydrogenase family)
VRLPQSSLLRPGMRYASTIFHRGEAAEEVVRHINKENGRATAIQGDISSEAEVVSLFREADSRLGRVRALVNNASTLEQKAA